jgi:hypothetical protein
MATGFRTQLTRQIGEHLVTAELGRMGYIATPFAGNVPSVDILVATVAGVTIPVHVKAINGPSWQFTVSTFLKVDIKAGVQKIRGLQDAPNPSLVCILVLLRSAGKDEFYSLTFRQLQKHFLRTYKGGRRPKNPDSLHCAIWPKDLSKYVGWGALHEAVKLSTARPRLQRGGRR